MPVSSVFVNRCAPGPCNPSLRFDKHQFHRRRISSHVVTPESRLTFSDIHNMHVITRVQSRDKRWLPPWANNDEQLKQVLLVRGWRYVHGGTLPPPDITFEEVKRQVDEHFENVTCNEGSRNGRHEKNLRIWYAHESHIRAAKRAGGWMELLTAVVYRSLRLGRDSVSVAQETGMMPWGVRQIIARANEVAIMLGFETFAPHTTRRTPYEELRQKGTATRKRQYERDAKRKDAAHQAELSKERAELKVSE